MKGLMRFFNMMLGLVFVFYMPIICANSIEISKDLAANKLYVPRTERSETPLMNINPPPSALMRRDSDVIIMMGHLIANGHIWLMNPSIILLGSQFQLVAVFISELSVPKDKQFTEKKYKVIALYEESKTPGVDPMVLKTKGLIETNQMMSKKFKSAAARVITEHVINMSGVKEAKFVTVKDGVIEFGTSKKIGIKREIKPKKPMSVVTIKLVLKKTSPEQIISVILRENKQSIDGGVLTALFSKNAINASKEDGLNDMLLVSNHMVWTYIRPQEINIDPLQYTPVFISHASILGDSLRSRVFLRSMHTYDAQLSPEIQIWADHLKVRCELMEIKDMSQNLSLK